MQDSSWPVNQHLKHIHFHQTNKIWQHSHMSSQLLSLKIPSNKPCKMDLIILKASESELHPKMNTVVHLHLRWSRKPPIHTIRNRWETLHDTQPYMALFKTTYIHDPSFPCHLYKTAPRTLSQTTLTPLPTSTYLLFPFLPLCFLQPTLVHYS